MRRRPIQFGNPQLGGDVNTDGLNQGGSNRGGGQASRATQIGNVQSNSDGTPRSVSQDDSDRQQAWNTHAANQYEALHGLQLSNATQTDDDAVKHEQARIGFARAMGYDPRNMPPMSQMMQRWATLPLPIKAGIIKAGGAQFLDQDEGTKLLQKYGDEHDSMVNDQIKNVASDLSKGDAQLERDPQTGKLSGYKWADDPTKFPGTSPKIKMPFNDVQDIALQSGLKSGAILTSTPQSAAVAIQPQLPSTGQFQQILDARAATGQSLPLNLNASGTIGAGAPPPMTTDQFQQVLNARAAGQDTPSSVVNNVLNKAHPSAQAYGNNSGDTLDSNLESDSNNFISSQNVPQAVDAATALGQRVASSLGNVQLNDNDIPKAIGTGVNVATDLANIPSRLTNYGMRFLGGMAGAQAPQIPLIPQVVVTPRSDDGTDDAVDLASGQWGP